MFNKKFFLVFALIMYLTGCACTSPKEKYSECSTRLNTCSTRLNTLEKESYDRFVLKSSDNQQTSSEFATFLKAKAFDATLLDEKSVRVKYQNSTFILSPKVSKGGLSRIVVENRFGIESKYRGTIEILKYAIKLNQSFNVATFSVGDPSTLVMQSSVTFVDKLDAEEIKKFLEYINTSVLGIILTMPETILYLE